MDPSLERAQTASNSRPQAKQKRARSQLSCTHCRAGKLRCNRESPICDQCMKRDRASSCNYLPPAQKNRSGQNIKGRIHHLEQLVVDLMNSRPAKSNGLLSTSQGQSPDLTNPSRTGSHGVQQHQSWFTSGLTPPQEPDFDQSPPHPGSDIINGLTEDALGRMKISGDETSYVADYHWTAILDSITELKLDLNGNDNSPAENDHAREDQERVQHRNPDEISSLLRSPLRLTKAELLGALPPRQQCDRLLYQWFNAPDPFKPLVHPPTFQKEYMQFWSDPCKTPTMWLALLFTIISLSTGFLLRNSDDRSSPNARRALDESQRYHDLAASAAVLAEYTTPKPYVIECLVLYSSGIRSRHTFTDVWQLLGLTIRLALRMGYHRDGSHYKNLTVFQQEMRRRVWYGLYMIDTLVSFQVGLPGTLRVVQSDVQPPRNLFDHDLDPHMLDLPPSRTKEELTPMSYHVAKVQICSVFASAAEISHVTVPPTYAEIMDLDAKLETTHDLIPPMLQLKSFDQSIIATSETMMWTFNLELLYLKTKLILHRRFMKASDGSSVTLKSQKDCIHAAMQIIRLFQNIDDASQPGGQLEVPKWYMNSISSHDFLLAAMVLCLELSRQHEAGSRSGAAQDVHSSEQGEIIELLEKTQVMLQQKRHEAEHDLPGQSLPAATFENRPTVSEASKACRALSVMLAKVKPHQPSHELQQAMNVSDACPSADGFENNTTAPSSRNWDFTTNITEDLLQPAMDPSMADYSMIENMMSGQDDIDWDMWDKQMQNTNVDTNPQFHDWLVDDLGGTGQFEDGFLQAPA